MNRRTLLIVSIVVATCLIIIALKPEILAMAFSIVFIGIVPGTDITLPAWLTLGTVAVLLAFAVYSVFDAPAYRPHATHKDLALRARARRKTTRRTATTTQRTAHRYARAKA